MHVVYLGLGSNLGERERYVAEAIARIGERVGQVVRQSSLYVTEPWGFRSVHPFVNAVVCCQTSLTPRQLLCATQQIERELGRRHKSHDGAYEDRTIDIDILLYDDLRVDEPDLQIPHPLMYEREFVMQPLREIME
jgi:2-amino-4-hydroxy-6-hydroxymethyldihydropteridine diphosphokinase